MERKIKSRNVVNNCEFDFLSSRFLAWSHPLVIFDPAPLMIMATMGERTTLK